MLQENPMLPRHSAGSFELKGGTGPLTAMQSCGEFLEIYKVDKTFRVQSPESIDPEETNPNALWVTAPFDDVGSGNPIIARVLLQNSEILNAALFENKPDKEEVILILHTCKEALIACEKISIRINKQVESICSSIQEEGIKRDNHGRGLNPFPQIANLDTDCGTFLIQANRAIKAICEIPTKFFSLTRVDSNFDYLIKRLESENNQINELIPFLKETTAGIRYLIDLRNFHEHPTKQKKTTIKNFTLTPDSKIQLPQWFVTGNDPSPIHQEMTATIKFLMEVAEATFLHTVMASVSKKLPYILVREQEDKINTSNPILFRLSFDTNKLNIQNTSNKANSADAKSRADD